MHGIFRPYFGRYRSEEEERDQPDHNDHDYGLRGASHELILCQSTNTPIYQNGLILEGLARLPRPPRSARRGTPDGFPQTLTKSLAVRQATANGRIIPNDME